MLILNIKNMNNSLLKKNNLSSINDENNKLNNFSDIFSVSGNKINIYMKHFKKSNDYTNFLTYIITIMNYFDAKQKKENLTNFLDIFVDFKGIVIGKLDINFLKELINYLKENYEEIISTIYCYNVTSIFKFLYSIIKPFIDKGTRKKIKFLKNNQLNNLQDAINIESAEYSNFDF